LNNGTYGAIGLGSVSDTAVVTEIAGISNIENISGGYSYFSVIMDSSGYLWSTGRNQFGELGQGNTVTYKNYTKISGKKINSDIENQTLELGETREIEINIENLINLKNDLLDDNQENFSVTAMEPTKLYVDGKKVSALSEGISNLVITHIPSGTTKQVPVEVVDTTTGFEISTMPKISYKYGEPLDLSGGKLTVTKGAGDVIVDIIPQMVSGYNPNILGPQTLTVSVSDFTQTYEVTVSDFVTGITVAPPTKTQYLYGNNLDLAGSSLVENFASGAVGEEIILDSGMVSGFDSNTIGAQIITVKHSTANTIDDTIKEFTDTFNISLEDYVVNTDIAAPSKLIYIHGETIDLTDGTIVETMASGAVNSIILTAEMITESDDSPVVMSPGSYDGTNKLDKTLKITYGGTNQNYPITIINDVKSISLTSTPKTEYNVNDILDVTGGEILITRAVGTSLETLTVGMVTGFDSSAEGTNMPLTINYTENGITKNTTYNINITDDIIGFTITNLPKTNYKYGEALDVTGGTLTVQRGSGDAQINITAEMVSGYNPNTLGEQTLTVTYLGFTKNYEVTVLDFVTGIILSYPTKIEYKYNEDLDLTDGLVTTVMASGDVGSSIAITSGMVTGYNKTIIGNQTVTVTYTTTNTIDDLSTDFTENYNVSVGDYVVGINVTPPTKVVYQYGESLDLTGASGIEEMASGALGNPIVITSGMVSGYNPNTLGTQTLTVKYTTTNTIDDLSADFTDTFDVTVEDYVANIAITAPTKSVYNHGETLDLTGGTIVETMASGAVNNIIMTAGMITESDDSPVVMNPGSYDGTNKLDKTLKITYGGTTQNYPITIINDVKSIAVTSSPKTDYNVNDLLDVTGGQITITRAVGTSVEVLTSEMVTGFDSSVEGNNIPLTVTYTENGITKNTTYNINVADLIIGFTITSLPKTNYKYGEDLNVTGGKLTIQKGSGDTEIDLTSGMVSGYNPNTLGTQTLTVTYGGFTQNYDVTVLDFVNGITVTNPIKVTYQYGEALDLTGSSLVENYASGAVGTSVTVTSGMVSGYNPNTLGTQTLTVKYTTTNTIDDLSADFTDTFDVTVEDYVANIAITEPTKSVYNHGESLDLTGGTIVETMASGAVNNVTMTAGMMTETDDSLVVMNPGSYDETNKLDKTLKITYGGTTQNYHITIINDVKSIAVTSSPKTDYNVNDLLDVTGGQITITRAVGTSVETLTSGMVTGFDSSVEGNNIPLTVTYTENGITQTTAYNINVADLIIGFTITSLPKTNYKYVEDLDVTGGKLTVQRGSGDTLIDLTSGMVSGYNPYTLGTQTLTVTYGGFTQNYDIVVYDYVSDIILNQPDKIIYKYNEELDLLGGEIIPIMASGLNLEAVALTLDMISGYDKTLIGIQIITITYEGITKQLNITVENNLENIVMFSYPDKTIYKYGEQIDLTGAKIKKTNSDETTEIINIQNSMVTGYSEITLGTQEITVSITENGITKTTKFTVTVEDYIQDIQILEFKTTYILNENLDLDNSKIIPIMASGAMGSQAEITDNMITGFDTSVEGAKELTITYEGITKVISITVSDPITGITIQAPTKVEYLYGEYLDLTDATVSVNKASGAIIGPINITYEMVTGYNPNILGVQTLTVSYLEQINTFNVNVQDWDKELRIVTMPKTNYEYGESLDVENGKVAIYTASGVISSTMPVVQPVEMTTGMVSEFDPLKEGIQELTVSWNGFRATYNINLVNLITDISIYSRPDSLNFKYGEELNLTGFTIKIKKDTGDYILEVSPSMISGYDKNILGEQTITVSYGGKKVDFVINVKENIEEGIEEDPLENDNETNNSIIPNEGDTEAGVIENNQDIEQIIEPDEIIIPDEVKPDNDEGDLDEKPSITLGEQANAGNTKEKIILILMIGTGLFISTILIFGFKRRNIEKK